LAFLLIFAFNVCVLLGLLLWGTTTSIEDLVFPLQITAPAYAQMAHHIDNSTTSNNSEGLDAMLQDYTPTTFSARGPISSLVITVPESHFNITNAFKVVLTGAWNLTVNDGNVVNFAIKFIASPMDGSGSHIHEITDFRPYNNGEPIRLTDDNSLSINGTADIKINDAVVWENADISISFSKGNIFTFDPNDVDTENHFGDQQVYGIISRLTK
jgi:hypothetical protein